MSAFGQKRTSSAAAVQPNLIFLPASQPILDAGRHHNVIEALLPGKGDNRGGAGV